VLLPALARLGVPLPLGGTSNHFPRDVLEEVGA
jgi:cellulose synthase/poly-beta-1,6-N-acetylglucosamine synthase-like glycosyltransferase